MQTITLHIAENAPYGLFDMLGFSDFCCAYNWQQKWYVFSETATSYRRYEWLYRGNDSDSHDGQHKNEIRQIGILLTNERQNIVINQRFEKIGVPLSLSWAYSR